MAGTFARLALLVVPLLAVAIHSAPTWPARAQMWEGPGRDLLLHSTQQWESAVCHGTQQHWCKPTQEAAVPPSVAVVAPTPPARTTISTPHQIETPIVVDPVRTMAATAPAVAAESAIVRPGTVLMLGDSLMTGVATGLRGELPGEYKIVDRAKPSTGLCNQAYYDWPSTAGQFAGELQPNWVIIHLGGNDGQDILFEGKWLRFGSEAWTQQYLSRAEQMIRQVRAAAPGATIAWVGLPAMRPGKFADKSQKIEQLQRLAAQQQGVAYIDGINAMGGAYQKSGPGPDGRVTVLRSDDGIHYSRAGGGVLGQALGRQMRWPIKHP